MQSHVLCHYRGKPVLAMGSEHASLQALWSAAGSPDGDLHWSRFIGDPKTLRRIGKLRDEEPGTDPFVTDGSGEIFVHKYLGLTYASDLSTPLWKLVNQRFFGEEPTAPTGPSARKTVEAPMTAAQLAHAHSQIVHAHSQILVDQERTLAEHGQDLEQLNSRVDAIEQDKEQARKALAKLPVPDPSNRKKITRVDINMLVRNFAKVRGITEESDYKSLWGAAYRQLYSDHHFNASARAKNQNKILLDVVEDAGMLWALYEVMYKLYIRPDRLWAAPPNGVKS